MITAALTIGVSLVGLLLAVWWLGGRPFLARLAREDERSRLQSSVMARHGVRLVDVPRVESAVTWGRALDTAPLRAAAVDWAREVVELDRRRRTARPGRRAALLAVAAGWAALVLGRVAFLLVQGRWGDVRWDEVVLFAGVAVVLWRLHTGPRRAIERNGGAAPR